MDDRNTKANNTYSIAPFSSRGPTKEGLRKPDVVAPGVNIRSLSNSDGYSTLSGTSMATPVVSGSLALLLSRDSRLGPKELKSEIMKSCTSLNEKPDNQGAGIISMNRLFKGKDDKREPSRSRYSKPERKRPVRKNPTPKPISTPIHSGGEAVVEKQSYMADGLIFILFLILVLIRIL